LFHLRRKEVVGRRGEEGKEGVVLLNGLGLVGGWEGGRISKGGGCRRGGGENEEFWGMGGGGEGGVRHEGVVGMGRGEEKAGLFGWGEGGKM